MQKQWQQSKRHVLTAKTLVTNKSWKDPYSAKKIAGQEVFNPKETNLLAEITLARENL